MTYIKNDFCLICIRKGLRTDPGMAYVESFHYILIS
jgi:hypothetical protein